MTLEFRLTVDHLHYLATVFEKFDATYIFKPNVELQKKVAASICLVVGEKIITKYDKLSRRNDLFNSKKRYRLTITYHEAYAVLVLLRQQKEADPYRKMMALTIDLIFDKKVQ